MKDSVTKQFKISYGHLLTNHTGQCSRDHGHNARIEITVSGEIWQLQGESSSGMIVDFGDLKKVVNDVIGRWDHRFLACGDEWNVKLAQTYAPIDRLDNFVILGFPTTAENLARETLRLVQHELERMIGGLVVESVRWWETDDNYAECSQGVRRE